VKNGRKKEKFSFIDLKEREEMKNFHLCLSLFLFFNYSQNIHSKGAFCSPFSSLTAPSKRKHKNMKVRERERGKNFLRLKLNCCLTAQHGKKRCKKFMLVYLC
jgi:hypothetical protein